MARENQSTIAEAGRSVSQQLLLSFIKRCVEAVAVIVISYAEVVVVSVVVRILSITDLL